jgi:gliding motility-associated-like protein
MKLFLLLFLLFPIYLIGQNLVKNPSFDLVDLDGCYNLPIGTSSAFPLLFDWSYANEPALTNGPADLFHYCTDNLPWASHIPNVGLSYQFPNTGSGFAGIFAFDFNPKPPDDTIIPYSDYVQGEIITPLDSGVTYIFSCFFSLNDVNLFTCKNIAVYLSSTQLNENRKLLDNFNPQVLINSYITQKDGWEKVQIPFVSNGGEKFFVIGNFTPYSLMDTLYVGDGNIDYGIFGYYFIDDVAIYPADAPVYAADAGGDQLLCKGESATLGSQWRSQYLYWWYDAQGNLIDTTAQITVSPDSTTFYVLQQKDFKFDETSDTVIVYVSDCESPLYIPNIFSPNSDGNNDIFCVRGEGISEIKTFVIYNRWGEEVFSCRTSTPLSAASNECGWDGTCRGEPAPQAIYTYYVEAVLLNGETVVKRGNVTLVR